KWFRYQRRAALTAITLVGAFSSFIFSPLTGTLTAEHGWRGALMVLAVILAAVGIPLHAAVLRPAPVAATEEAVSPARGHVRAVLRSRRFWFLAIALALGSYTWSAILVQLVPSLIDAGYGIQFGALAAGVVGIGQLPGRLVYVIFGRALRGARLPVATFGLAVAALAVLSLDRSEGTVLVFALVFGMSAGMLTLMSASVPAELFGRHVYGTLSGVIYGCSNGARAVAPFASAAIALLPGGYATLFGSLMLSSLLAATLGFLALRGEASD
ncbi:MAG: MFS transporter, partial [Chloroflexi bacterium]